MVTNTKRIAKNSILLYFRTFVILIVSLYAVRVTLKVLGVEDYGIYNAIGGVVALLSFMTNTLTSVSQRYFSYYLGSEEYGKLREYFNSVFLIYLLITILLVIVGESLGKYLLDHYLTIPSHRRIAAEYVYHFSILSLAFSFLTIPYNSIIIAREEMGIYAYVSIIEAFLKLGVVFLLIHSDIDGLILYAILLAVISFLKFSFYASFSAIRYPESRWMLYYDRSKLRELVGYLGWNTYGVLAAVVKNHGLVVVLNIFFGPIINAAYAIANQIHNAINQFVSSFLLAVQPQIVKQYASEKQSEMMNLVFLSSRFSFYLLMIVAIPCYLVLPTILDLWLGEYPDYTIRFSRLLILNALFESLCTPLVTSIQATGRIRAYNIVLGSLLMMTIPVCLLLVRLGASPIPLLGMSLLFTVLGQVVRIYYMHINAGMSIKRYSTGVLLKLLIVIVVSVIPPAILSFYVPQTVLSSLLIVIISLFSSFVTIYFVGLEKNERDVINTFFLKIIEKWKNRTVRLHV